MQNRILGSALSNRIGLARLVGGCLTLLFLVGCATTRVQPPSIPAGKSMIVLEAGGVESLNFGIFDQNTGEKVVETAGLTAFVPPGIYKLVVQTDIDQPVVIDSVKIQTELEKHIEIPVGRFIMTVSEQYTDEQGEEKTRRVRPRFTIYDYTLSRPLAKGITTFPPKRYVLPIGDYKVSIELPGTFEQRIIKEAKIRFGRIYPLEFQFTSRTR
ncbi:MAG: hypothetical protein J7J76_00785 [Candidatus Latescibacteria bacterium]|nr:hypothetical protein [Candidatus Latescibacterota bacterium]